jgi:replication factor A1
VILSDGQHFQQGIMAVQLHNLIDSGDFKELSVIRLKDYMVNTVKQRKIVVLLGVEVLEVASDKLGNPQYIDQPKAEGAAPSAAPAAPSAQNANPNPAPARPVAPSAPVAMRPAGLAEAAMPIAQLNPYQSRWTIRARVTAKTPVRTWSNDRGTGRLFSVDLLDAQGGEIRATCFNDAVDKFYPMLEEGKVFTFSKGVIKFANKKFTSLKHDYEITLNPDAIIYAADDATDIAKMKYQFVPISSIGDIPKDNMVDVVGLVMSSGELTTIVTKADVQLSKRTLTIVDTTARAIELTLWGNTAETYSQAPGATPPIVAIKGVRVSDYGGRSLSAVSSSSLAFDPTDVEEVTALRDWFNRQGGSVDSLQTYPMTVAGGGAGASGPAKQMSLEQVKQSGLGMSTSDVYETVGTVWKVKSDGVIMYDACPSEGCRKKVVEEHGGQWRCEKCDKLYNEPHPRYIMSLTFADYSGSHYMALFNDQAEELLGKTAASVRELQQANDTDSLKMIFDGPVGKDFRVRVRAKPDTYNDEVRVRHSILSIKPLDYAAEAALLAKQLE